MGKGREHRVKLAYVEVERTEKRRLDCERGDREAEEIRQGLRLPSPPTGSIAGQGAKQWHATVGKRLADIYAGVTEPETPAEKRLAEEGIDSRERGDGPVERAKRAWTTFQAREREPVNGITREFLIGEGCTTELHPAQILQIQTTGDSEANSENK